MTHGTAKALLERARRRIDKLEGRADLATVDPLACEIALAQLDATMSLSAAIQEATATIKGNVTVEVKQERFGLSPTDRNRLYDIESSLRTLEGYIQDIFKRAVFKEDAGPDNQEKPWWRRL